MNLIRNHGFDVAKLASAWAVWWGTYGNAAGAFLSAVFTLLLILEKLGLLTPLRNWCARRWTALTGRAAA